MKKLIYLLAVLALLVPAVALADAPHDLIVEESHVCYPDGTTNIKAYVTPYPTGSGSFDCCDRFYVRIFVDGVAKVWDEYHAYWWRFDNLEVSWVGELAEGEHTIKAEWGRYNINAMNPFGNVRESEELVIDIQPCIQTLDSRIDLDPDTLNVKGKGKWVTAYIELLDGYDVADIDVSTVMLEGTIHAEDHPTDVGDYDDDGIPDLMVKFDRQALIQYLDDITGEVTLTVSGELSEVTHFAGSDTITVIN